MSNRKKEFVDAQNIEMVRKEVEKLIGKEIVIVDNFTKPKKVINVVVSKTFDNLFVVNSSSDDIYVNKTYSYFDIISNRITIEEK